MSRRVLLHVGTPKTGTSQLQDVLFRNRPQLELSGIRYPADRFDAHFLAALDLLQMPWGGLEREAVGRWDWLAQQVRDWHGTSIISHEILAAATREQAARALASLGDAEVHLVLSVRDLVRQIPAEWQENIKHRSTLTYDTFLDQIRDPARASRIGSWFWKVQELPEIIDRWGGDLPPERVHLVTVPPSGSPHDLLWQRFSRTFGLGEVALDLESQRANPSMGVPETALIRRLNLAVNDLLPPPDYRPLVRELIVHQTLSRRSTSPRLSLAPEVEEWVKELEDRWPARLREGGYRVDGDLEELRGSRAAGEYADPGKPDENAVTEAAIEALTAVLLDDARLRHETGRVHEELVEARAELEQLRKPATLKAKERAVAELMRSRPGRAAMGAYRFARGRSSRSA